jgi:hypothetical protein
MGGLVLAVALPLLFEACSKNDEKPKASGVTFEKAEETTHESNQTWASFNPKLLSDGGEGWVLEVKILLDRAAAEKSEIEYSIDGTATRDTSTKLGDFDIDGDDEVITIEKGQSEATIKIRLFEDTYLFTPSNSSYTENDEEDDDGVYETITLKLDKVKSGALTIGDQDEYTLKIYEDDMLVILEWLALKKDSVDMDLLAWSDQEEHPIAASAKAVADSVNAFEVINLFGGFPYNEVGLSYTYYSGTSDSVAFAVNFINFGGALNSDGPNLTYESFYTHDNVNRYDSASHPDHKDHIAVVQTATRTGFNYSVSEITKEANTSRMRGSHYTAVKRGLANGQLQFQIDDRLKRTLSGQK